MGMRLSAPMSKEFPGYPNVVILRHVFWDSIIHLSSSLFSSSYVSRFPGDDFSFGPSFDLALSCDWKCVYSHLPSHEISVSHGPHASQWSHSITMEWNFLLPSDIVAPCHCIQSWMMMICNYVTSACIHYAVLFVISECTPSTCR